MKIGVEKDDSIVSLKSKVRILVFFNNTLKLDFRSLMNTYSCLRRDYDIIRRENNFLKNENLRLARLVDKMDLTE